MQSKKGKNNQRGGKKDEAFNFLRGRYILLVLDNLDNLLLNHRKETLEFLKELLSSPDHKGVKILTTSRITIGPQVEGGFSRANEQELKFLDHQET